MSYDYKNRRERNEPTAQKRRRGERPAVPLDQRPGNPGYRKPVDQRWLEIVFIILFVIGVCYLIYEITRLSL